MNIRRSGFTKWITHSVRVWLLLAAPLVITAEHTISAEVEEALFTPIERAVERTTNDSGAALSRELTYDPQDWSDSELHAKHNDTLRRRDVHVDRAKLAALRSELAQDTGPQRLNLNLFPDFELTAIFERTGMTRHGYSLSGRLEGDHHGSVTFVVVDDIMAGAIHTHEGNFVISATNGVIHTVREVDDDWECGVDHEEDAFSGALDIPHEHDQSVRQSMSPLSEEIDDGSEIDVLVVFTEAALRVEGTLKRMQASIDLAVAFTNDAYEASGAMMRLNLVGATLVDYVESDIHGRAGLFNQGEDLNRLIDPEDGYMDDVLKLRDAYAADIVHVVVDQHGGGGQGSILNINREVADHPSYSFSISNSVLRSPSLFAHEVGHVLGLRHDRYVDPTDTLYPYSHGYVNQLAFTKDSPPNRGFHTIMAYSAQCRDEGVSCPRIPYFSNPDLRYPDADGDPIGVPGDEQTHAVDGPANATRSLNETRELIAGFRNSKERCEYTLANELSELPAVGGSFTVNVTTREACVWNASSFSEFLTLDADQSDLPNGVLTFTVNANAGSARAGHVVIAGETLAIYQSGGAEFRSVCDRGSPIRTALESVLGKECDDISEFDLLDVTKIELKGPEAQVNYVDEFDFAGLSHLSHLSFLRNQVETIHDDAFRDLALLTYLKISRGVLNKQLRSVPRAIQSLVNLRHLQLLGHRIDVITRDAFKGLHSLEILDLNWNQIKEIEGDTFAGLVKLRLLHLRANDLRDVTKRVLNIPESIQRVDLTRNQALVLREDMFENIPEVFELFLANANLEQVPTGIFDSLTKLGFLDLSQNALETEDLAAIRIPGNSIWRLDLDQNLLRELPDRLFEGFISGACGARNMQLNVLGNPGVPFPLTVELVRTDGGLASPGPASVAVRLRQGAPWPINVHVIAGEDTNEEIEVTIANGNLESEPIEVSGTGPVRLRLAGHPRVPGSYQGVRVALGDDLLLFDIPDQELPLRNERLAIDLNGLFFQQGVTYEFDAETSDDSVATVSVTDGTLNIEGLTEGLVTVSLTALAQDGQEISRTFDVRVVTTSRVTDVPHLPVASPDSEALSGVVRLINHSTNEGECRIDAFDGSGNTLDTLTLPLQANAVQQLSQHDLVDLSESGLDPLTSGDAWRLKIESELDVEALSYVTSDDGYIAPMHDVVTESQGLRPVPYFTPADSVDQLSTLKLINRSDDDELVAISGVDETGETPGGLVGVTVPAQEAVSFDATQFETGDDLIGALGDGEGVWRLRVTAGDDVQVVNLLESSNGLLANLSTIAPNVNGSWVAPWFPTMADEFQREGVLHISNLEDDQAIVHLTAFDTTGREYDALTLTLDRNSTVQLGSDDLELGNEDRGLVGSTGAGEGSWAVQLTSDDAIQATAYVRSLDGSLTPMHDIAPSDANRYRVATLWTNEESRTGLLRFVNSGDEAAEVSIRGIDDAGEEGDEAVRTVLPARSAATFTTQELVSGSESLAGALGRGIGNWRLMIQSDQTIKVASLVETEDGRITNLSTAPQGR